MVYKRYIKRGGKVCGPYYYESYRDKKGNVKTRFIKGPTKKDKIINNINKLTNINNKPVKRAFVALSLIFLIFSLVFILSISAIKINNLYKNIAGFSVSNTPEIINENLIKITDAEHLDENRNYIENIFDKVNELDNRWSPLINESEYLRIKFEKNLTKKDDITIYARKSNLSGESYDNETEILTEEGWKYFYELNETDKVATLNNQTGELKWQKPSDYSIFDNGNDDMYQINLEDRSGRESELVVSENHRVYVSNLEGRQDISNLFLYNIINFPLHSSGLTSLINLSKDSINNSSFFCGILNQIRENISSSQNSRKSSSLVTNILCSDLENCANLPFASPFDLKITSKPFDFKNNSNFFLTFSSNKNLSSACFHSNNDIVSTFSNTASIMQSCFDMLFSKWCNKTINNFINRSTIFEHFKNLPNHDSCAFECRLSMTDICIYNNIGVNFDSHCKRINSLGYINISIRNRGLANLSEFKFQKITETYRDFKKGKEIYFLNSKNKPLRVNNIKKVPYKGKIYDVDVPNDIVLVKRGNGIPVWSGNSNQEPAEVSVYRKDDNTEIARFTNITSGNWYKVYLTGLNEGESTDVFDLKILNNSVEFDYIVDPPSPPNVYLISPSNGTSTTSATQYFVANFTEDVALLNATLYVWNSTGSVINNTENRTITGTYNLTNISIILLYADTFKWNYYACDNSSACNWNSANFTITYSTSDTPPNQTWNISGPIGTAYGIAVDNNGSVYVTGTNNSDYFTIKYNATNGSQVWNVSYNGGADDKAYGVSADNQGFIYLTGVADIDAGNYATFKYNSTNGSQIWNVSYGDLEIETAYGIAVNGGFVYVTGSINIGLNQDYYTIKYNATNGSQIWNATYEAAGTNTARGIAVDNESVYVTGNAGLNHYTIKYNATNGSEIWNKLGPIGIAYSIATDNQGFIYVTGVSNNNYITFKYNSTNGSQIWNATFNSGGVDTARGIALDSSGNIYVTGDANGNYTTVRYNSTGNYQWNITDVAGTAYGIAVDSSGFIYVTGVSNSNYYTIKYNTTSGGADTTPPVVNLISPLNNTNTASATQYFISNFTDNIQLKNTTLYIWNSSNSAINITNVSITGTSNSSNISVTLPYQGNFTWNYYACDNSSNCAWNNTNFTLTYDNIFPLLNITYPINTTYNLNVSALNYTIIETNPSRCWYSNSSGVWNSSSVAAGTNFTNVITKEGTNTLTLYCNDTAGNLNQTNVTFVKDTIYSLFSNYYDNNATLTGNGTAIFNVTVLNSNGTAFLEINGTNYTANNITLTTYNYSLGLTNGTYSYKWISWGNGTNKNFNVSEARSYSVNASASDSLPPNVTINSPLSQTYSTSLIGFNVTLNENGYCLYSLTSGVTNTTMNTTDNKTFFNSSTLSDGSYVVKFYCNDTAGNRNDSTNVSFAISTSSGGGSTGGGGGGSTITKKNISCSPGWNCTEWSVCINKTQTRTCQDKNNCNSDSGKPEESQKCIVNETIKKNETINQSIIDPKPKGIIDNIKDLLGINESEKIPDWKCTEWGKCNAVYTLSDLIKNNVLLKGEQTRTCYDKNKYFSDKTEKRECETRIPIVAKKIKKCFKEYIEIYDLNNTLISRLELTGEIYKKFDIEIKLDKTEYCNYCYDGIKNYDEEGVDCSNKTEGSCPICKKNDTINCFKDSDCVFISKPCEGLTCPKYPEYDILKPYCKGFKSCIKIPKCSRPGTLNSRCAYDERCTNCPFECRNGNCSIRCFKDSDCASEIKPFCKRTFAGSVLNSCIKIPKCSYPGTIKSECSTIDKCLSCKWKCENGICDGNLKITCYNDESCGTNRFTGDAFCSSDKKRILQNYTQFTCKNPLTFESSCSNLTISKGNYTCPKKQSCANGKCSDICITNCTNRQCGIWDNGCGANITCGTCPAGQGCSNGKCIGIACYNDSQCTDNNIYTQDICNNPGTSQSSCQHNAVKCINNSDCGTDSYIGEAFCSGKRIERNFIDYTCLSPGTSKSSCSNSTSLKIIQTCPESCHKGKCIGINCYNDLQCNDNNIYTNDICMNKGTHLSSCNHSAIACFNNSECGVSTTNRYCNGSRLCTFKSDNICMNPGTTDSICSSRDSEKQCNVCQYGCENNACKGAIDIYIEIPPLTRGEKDEIGKGGGIIKIIKEIIKRDFMVEINQTPGKTNVSKEKCLPDWKCSIWGECKDGNRVRKCEDYNSCRTESGKPNENEKCKVEDNLSDRIRNNIYLLLLILLIILSIFLLFFLLRRRIEKKEKRSSAIKELKTERSKNLRNWLKNKKIKL